MLNDGYDLGSSESYTQPRKPTPRAYLAVNPDVIPEELKRGTVFSPFRIEQQPDGKPKKVPFDANTGSRYEKGSVLDNLVSFEEALAACVKHDGNGVGRRLAIFSAARRALISGAVGLEVFRTKTGLDVIPECLLFKRSLLLAGAFGTLYRGLLSSAL